MRGLSTRRPAGDDGATLVLTAVALAAMLAFLTLAVDVGNWYLHKRHLQLQADASALSTAQEVGAACRSSVPDNQSIDERARQYAGYASSSGTAYNAQVADRQSAVQILINSETFFEQDKVDPTVDTRPPCESSMVDVKLTEQDLPFFFKVVNGLVPGNVVPAINAHARISIKRLDSRTGALPIAVPQAAPRRIRATFVNEATGATLGEAELKPAGTNAAGLGMWDNTAAPASITMPADSQHVGVRLALGEGSSVTCGQPLVSCFDGASADGLLHARAYPTDGTVTSTDTPRLRSVVLLPGTGDCARPSFVKTAAGCQVGLRATVDLGTNTPATRAASITATVGKTDVPLTFDSDSQTWVSASGIPVGAAAGPIPISLKWAMKAGKTAGETCTDKNNNPCQASFGTVQRVMSATDTRSGPIELAGLNTTTAVDVSAFPQGSVQSLVVRIGITATLDAAQSVGDPVVELRVAGNGSQNQSLDCDPATANLRDEIRLGCFPVYKRNAGTDCPASPTALWATAQPWSCVAVQTGGAVGQVDQGLSDRILGGSGTCTNPSRWSDYPDIDPEDPRLAPLLLTPYSSFSGQGSTTVPVQSFATFYITGWGGSPCAGDDPAPSGFVVGHFVSYVQSFADDTTIGATPCDFKALDPCFAQMTE